MAEVTKAIINSEIQRVWDRDGYVRASTVLEESKPKTAPLHPAFEWRDKVAAEEYRLEQARKIIRKARIIENGVETQLINVPLSKAVVNHGDADADPVDTREGYYKTASVIVQNLTEYEVAYQAAQQALSAARNRVAALDAAARATKQSDTKKARIRVAMKALSTAEAALSLLEREH